MRFPLSSPNGISPDAIDAAIATLRAGRFTMGSAVEQFERDFAAWVGSKHAVMVNSGSSANLLAVEALMRPSNGQPRWTAGDEILVPALAWSTTVWPLVQLGLVPVFVDVDPKTLAIDIDQALVMDSPRVSGMMLIHVLGRAAARHDVDDVSAAYASMGRPFALVEDCCESFGAHDGGKHVGTSGTMGTFSHFFSHQLTTGEGGTVVTDDDAIADDLRSMRAHGWTRPRTDRLYHEAKTAIDPRFLFVTTGYNLRPMELQGAMGIVQLQQVDQTLAQRDAAVRQLVDLIADVPWMDVLGARYVAKQGCLRTERRHSWMNLPCVLRPDAPMTRGTLLRLFAEHGVETRPLIAGNLLAHPAMRGLTIRRAERYPVADRLMRDGFMIGCHSVDGVEAVADAILALRKAA